MDFIECKVCHVTYDEVGHRPRNAPCGHELCSACIRALIKDSTFECPKCRAKHKVDTPDDMPVSFGLIDVIRAFKTMNIPFDKISEASASGATNEEICNIHCKSISHWCTKCQVWICDDCLESHISSIGCSTTILTKTIELMKEKQIKDKDMLMTIYEEDAKYVSGKSQELTKLAEEYDEEAKKLREESKKFSNLLKEGNIHKEKYEEAIKYLDSAQSPTAMNDRINMLTQRKQLLQSWSLRNLRTDTLLGFPKKQLEDGKDAFAEKVIKEVKSHAKISQHEKRIYLHSFMVQMISKGSICMSFDRLRKTIYKDPVLMFIELSLGGVGMGRVLVRLDKDMPNINENIINIITGQFGPTLNGIALSNCHSDILGNPHLSFCELPVTPDKNKRSVVKCGDVFGDFNKGYLTQMHFYIAAPPSTYDYAGHCIFGNVEDGLNIVKECYNNHRKGVKITDCGLVLEQE